MDPIVLVNTMRANIGKCIDFNVLHPGGLAIAAVKDGFRIVDVDDQGLDSEYIVNKNQEIHHVYPGNIIRGPYVCPENMGPNNVQMVAGKRRSTRRRSTRRRKTSRKGKSRRTKH